MRALSPTEHASSHAQVGVVSGDMIRELFNTVLANMVPDPLTTPPVLEVGCHARRRA